jgi:enoyl-CoA hydratase/carnithine racemase
VVVLEGAGWIAFLTGIASDGCFGEISVRAITALAHFDKPLLTMIRSDCVDRGSAIVLHADVRFAIPAARRGLTRGLALYAARSRS